MDLRRDAQHQPSGRWLPGGPPLLLAGGDAASVGLEKGVFP